MLSSFDALRSDKEETVVQTLKELQRQAKGNNTNKNEIATQAGVFLLQLCSSQSLNVRLESSSLLRSISVHEKTKSLYQDPSLLSTLLGLFDKESKIPVKTKLGHCLWNFTVSNKIKTAVFDAGGVPCFLEAVCSGDTELQLVSLGTLRNISLLEERKTELAVVFPYMLLALSNFDKDSKKNKEVVAQIVTNICTVEANLRTWKTLERASRALVDPALGPSILGEIDVINATMPKPTNKELVSLSMVPERLHVLAGKASRVHILLKMVSGKCEGGRQSFDLCVVLDRSGSMEGKPLLMAKRAVRKIIKHVGPDDCLNFVVFDDSANVQFQKENGSNKDKLTSIVKQVRSGGSTNILNGYKRGYSTLSETTTTLSASTKSRPKQIFIFSDGLDDKGAAVHENIFGFAKRCAEKKVYTSAFGIGDSFDEKLMKGIAVNGSGSYAFISTVEDIPKAVSKGIHGLMDVVGSGATLSFKGTGGLVVRELVGKEKEDVNGPISLGDIIGENSKNYLLAVDIVPPPTPGGPVSPTLEYVLEYLEEGQKATTKVTGSISLIITDDEKLVSTPSDPDVHIAIVIKEAGKLDNTVATKLASGDSEGAKAIKHEAIAMLRTVESLDTTGHVTKLISKSLLNIEEMNSNRAKAVKRAHYNAYNAEEDDAYNYDSGSDSDEGACWSGEEEECGALTEEEEDDSGDGETEYDEDDDCERS